MPILEKVAGVIHRALHPPHHIRVTAIGDTLEECLRNLERAAGLPKGDLSVSGEPREVATFPLYKTGLSHFVTSKTADAWKADATKQGYIAGSVFESTSSVSLDKEQQDRMKSETLGFIAIADAINFFGSLHMSKNCPGVYRDNVCTTCGDYSRD